LTTINLIFKRTKSGKTHGFSVYGVEVSGAVHDITADHCTFKNAVKAVFKWSRSGWVISHNDIVDLRTRNGGDIGILVADRFGGIVQNNLISRNKILGTMHVDLINGGGYSRNSIVAYAVFRWGMAGALDI
jgi:polygalacturonase